MKAMKEYGEILINVAFAAAYSYYYICPQNSFCPQNTFLE